MLFLIMEMWLILERHNNVEIRHKDLLRDTPVIGLINDL